jgi:hypothetical protein
MLDALEATPPPGNGLWLLYAGLEKTGDVNIKWASRVLSAADYPSGRVHTWIPVEIVDSRISAQDVRLVLYLLRGAASAWGANKLKEERKYGVQ